MDMSQPPQPTYQPGGQPYQTDKILGIIIMVLSVCGVIGGIMILAGGGILAAAGAGAAANSGTQGATAAAGIGLIVMIVAVYVLIQSALGFAVGYGIMKSLRWGFLLGSIIYGIGILLQVIGMTQGNATQGIFGLAISVGLFTYCFMRLTGKTGPPLNG